MTSPNKAINCSQEYMHSDVNPGSEHQFLLSFFFPQEPIEKRQIDLANPG